MISITIFNGKDKKITVLQPLQMKIDYFGLLQNFSNKMYESW